MFEMKKIFYVGIAGIILFEILNVYFIMPMPGSQRINSLDVAYFLYRYRWFLRIGFGLLVAAGSAKAFQINRKWIPAAFDYPPPRPRLPNLMLQR